MSIFTQTTCLKSDLLNKMVSLMTSAGWNNISSDPTSDFVVMQSDGEKGDKNLVFQIRSSNASNANDITTNVNTVMSYRLVNGYTPNESNGIAGVFTRPSETWRLMQIASGASVDPSVELTLWYSVNKDRAIFNIYTPESLNLLPVLIYCGIPIHYTSEPDSRGLVVMTSYASSFSNSVHVSDNVAELPNSNASISITNTFPTIPKSPNSAGVHTPFEVYYGNASVGIRGKIDSIYFLPNNSINDGDILRLGAKRFRATQIGLSGNNSFPTNNIIYQIS